MEYYIVTKRKEVLIDTCYNMNESRRHYTKWKSVTKDNILDDSIYMKCSEQRNLYR